MQWNDAMELGQLVIATCLPLAYGHCFGLLPYSCDLDLLRPIWCLPEGGLDSRKVVKRKELKVAVFSQPFRSVHSGWVKGQKC